MMKRTLFLLLALLACAFVTGESSRASRAASGTDSGPSALPQQAAPQARAHNHRQQDDWFDGQRAFPGKQIPPGALVKARQSLQSAPLAPAVAAAPWTAIGPAPIGSGAEISVTGPVTGRITSIAAHPSDSNVIYVGAASGGVWKTTNGGATWSPLTDSQSSLAIGALTIDPTNPDVIYAGTGENNSAGPPFYGVGVLKSVDGGSTWTLLATSTFSACRVGKIVVDPTSPSTLYLASIGTYDDRAPENLPNSCLGGIYKSTDAGVNWTRKLAGATGSADDIVIDPSAPSTLYASIGGDGVYKSVDAGDTWSATSAKFDPPVGRFATIVLAIAPSSPQTLYAGFGSADGSLDSIRRTADGGANWTNLGNVSHYCDQYPPDATGALSGVAVDSPTAGTTTLTSTAFHTSFSLVDDAITMTSGPAAGQTRVITAHNQTAKTIRVANFTLAPAVGNNFKAAFPVDQCDYDNVLLVDRTDPNIVYAGGIDLFKSTNGGATFTDLIGVFPGKIHVDQHALAFDSSGRLLVGNDGGIWRTPDGGSSFTDLNGNLGITQFYPGMAAASGYLLGGTQDNGSAYFTGSTSWEEICGGDGGYAAIDPLNTSTGYCTFDFESDAVFITKSTNGGAWQVVTNGISTTEARQWITPLVMSPSNPNTLYVGLDRLYRTTNAASSWSAISPSLAGCTGVTDPPLVRRCGISAIGLGLSNSNVIYAGTSNATPPASRTLQVTTNGGIAWTDTAPNGLPNRFITDIAVNPWNAAEAYVVVSGFGSGGDVGHVFHTTSTGGSWSNVSGNLPNVPVNAIRADFRTIPAVLYVGSDLGVFRSTDGGTTWQNFNNGSLPNVVVTDVLLDTANNKLLATTYGRSAWVTDISPPIACNALAAPLPIPDNSSAGASDTITFTNPAAVTDLNVCVDVSHPFVGDLVVSLTHQETGTTVTIVDRPGVPATTFGCPGKNILAILDDEASAPVETQCFVSVPTIAGTFLPNNPLSAFDGAALAGHWTLKVTDKVAGYTGTLNGWSLVAATAGPVDTDGDGCIDAKELGPNHSLGGQRDPNNYWDFFDVTADRRIDLSDTLVVLQGFGLTPGAGGYDAALDRYAPNAVQPWRTAAAIDGNGIDLTDALVSLDSFGDDCN